MKQEEDARKPIFNSVSELIVPEFTLGAEGETGIYL
jgi:hypothetical protein